MENLLKKKSILTFLGIFLILVIWVNLVYLPGMHKIKSVQSERAALEQEVVSYKSLIADVSQIIQRVDQSQTDVQGKLDQIFAADSIPDYIRRLTALMDNYNIRRVKITPELPDLLDNRQTITIGNNILTVVDFKFNGQGRFLRLGQFLEQLHTQPDFAGVSLMNIHYNKSINPDVVFELKVSAYLKSKS